MTKGEKEKVSGRKRSYSAYVREYKRKKRQLEANGVEMRQRLYTEEEFQDQYTRLYNTKIDMGKKPVNITRELIDKQAFEISSKQALNYKGPETNWYKIRSGNNIKEFYYSKKEEFQTLYPDKEIGAGTYASKAVSMELFGSE